MYNNNREYYLLVQKNEDNKITLEPPYLNIAQIHEGFDPFLHTK